MSGWDIEQAGRVENFARLPLLDNMDMHRLPKAFAHVKELDRVATVALHLQGAVAPELDLLVGVVIDLIKDLTGGDGARNEWGAAKSAARLASKSKEKGRGAAKSGPSFDPWFDPATPAHSGRAPRPKRAEAKSEPATCRRVRSLLMRDTGLGLVQVSSGCHAHGADR